jgi:hypothetical protein
VPPPGQAAEADPEQIGRLATAAGLGTLAAAPVCLKRGAVSSWRVATGSGTFHLKWWPDVRWSWLRASLGAVAEIERAARSAGVEMAEPVLLDHQVGDGMVTVHRWVEGGEPVRAAPGLAAWLGTNLARMHTVPPSAASPADALESYFGLHPLDEWDRWIAEGADKAAPWAEGARAARPAIAAASRLVADALAAGARLVGAHRDLQASNILATPAGRFVVVDWDHAGPHVAWYEAVQAAVVFGRLAAGDGAAVDQVDLTVARELLAAYTGAGGAIGPWRPEALAGVLGMALGRIAYWMWLSNGHRRVTPDERREATAYLGRALSKLVQRVARADGLLERLASCSPRTAP